MRDEVYLLDGKEDETTSYDGEKSDRLIRHLDPSTFGVDQ